MRSRKFNKRIDIYETTAVPDGYGGNTVSVALVGTSWASIKTLNPGQKTYLTEFGILDANSAIMVTVRKRNDFTYNQQTHYFVYRGENYIINSFPTNIDFEDGFITMICTKEANKDD